MLVPGPFLAQAVMGRRLGKQAWLGQPAGPRSARPSVCTGQSQVSRVTNGQSKMEPSCEETLRGTLRKGFAVPSSSGGVTGVGGSVSWQCEGPASSLSLILRNCWPATERDLLRAATIPAPHLVSSLQTGAGHLRLRSTPYGAFISRAWEAEERQPGAGKHWIDVGTACPTGFTP